MRKSMLPIAVLLVLVSSGCVSSAGILEPEIDIRQITDEGFVMERRGAPVAIEYELRIHNNSGEPIRFIRLDLQTAGGGPYILRNTPERFDQEIAPGDTALITFSMWGVTRGGRTASIEPVTLSGVAHFDSPLGLFSKKFLRTIRQGARPRE